MAIAGLQDLSKTRNFHPHFPSPVSLASGSLGSGKVIWYFIHMLSIQIGLQYDSTLTISPSHLFFFFWYNDVEDLGMLRQWRQ